MGSSTDTAAPGDYDGDGRADRAVFRPATGVWHVLTSGSAYTSFFSVQWGLSADVPVPGDYDGDAITDLAVYRPSSGQWFILTSTSGYTTSLVVECGQSTDTPVAYDYDGDGKTDPAVFRPSNGTWYVAYVEQQLHGDHGDAVGSAGRHCRPRRLRRRRQGGLRRVPPFDGAVVPAVFELRTLRPVSWCSGAWRATSPCRWTTTATAGWTRPSSGRHRPSGLC